MDRLKMRPYRAADRTAFGEMLYEYLSNDLGETMTQERLSMVLTRIEYEMRMYPMWLVVIENDGQLIGFMLYQVDTPENPWGLRPGWGFIREIYIDRAYRRRGLGKAVAAAVCEHLRENGADMLYLTADAPEAVAFWRGVGFADSGVDCERNGIRIYTKAN